MSQPQPERPTNSAPYTNPALRVVRPAAEPEKPATPRTDPRIARQLTWDEIKYFIDHDPGEYFDEDFYRWMRFDMAIDLEPEIE